VGRMEAAVVGLGKMGSALARRLLDRGLAVTVYNRHPEAAADLVRAGASAAPRLADVWLGARVAMSFLADDEALTQVYLGSGGLVESAPQGAVLVEMSTVSPVASGAVARAATQRGLHYVRCPVSGNPGVLSAGELTLIVSGDDASVQAARPYLEHVGPRLYHVGSQEEARVVKLAVNAMLAASAQMLAETITLTEASGVPRAVFLDVLAGSAMGSPFVRYKTPSLLERRYDATFTTAMLLKDLRLAEDVAASARAPMPVTEVVTQLAEASCDEGLGDLDFIALLPHLQKLAGRPTDIPLS